MVVLERRFLWRKHTRANCIPVNKENKKKVKKKKVEIIQKPTIRHSHQACHPGSGEAVVARG